ncbi:MAG: hypothetical protein MZV65_53730 [Chromatiales bacterium]|nr:hypothetical protein [Chromatiales bacterium]
MAPQVMAAAAAGGGAAGGESLVVLVDRTGARSRPRQLRFATRARAANNGLRLRLEAASFDVLVDLAREPAAAARRERRRGDRSTRPRHPASSTPASR